MNPFLPLLLNIVYGVLFFIAFGIAALTIGAFALAIRDTLFRRSTPAEPHRE